MTGRLVNGRFVTERYVTGRFVGVPLADCMGAALKWWALPASAWQQCSRDKVSPYPAALIQPHSCA